LVSITANEPVNGKGDGNTESDIEDAEFGTDDRQFSLRAERSGTGSGRVYTITYRATDAAGNSALATATVIVPHDNR
ncbi:MAG: VWA domain-containing protein, partial [Pyrinomonadaceae bacterium]